MTEELQKKYARLLREGRTAEATKVAQEMNGSVSEEEVVSSEVEEVDEPVSEDVEKFAELKGVGDELAEEMVQVFGDYDSFVEDADVDSLSDIAGIGEKSAEDLLEQIEE